MGIAAFQHTVQTENIVLVDISLSGKSIFSTEMNSSY